MTIPSPTYRFSCEAIMFAWIKSLLQGFQPPKASGPAVQIKHFHPKDRPISGHARWEQEHLLVSATKAETVPLFELKLPQVDACILTYRFQISTSDMRSAVYPELWCRVIGAGEFFSRGLNQKLSGNNLNRTIEIQFLLRKGQNADLLKLNLVFEGRGEASLRGIEVLSTPIG
jgi:hypothetical protein